MKHRFDILLVMIFILSTGFIKPTDSDQDQPSISKAVALIKKYVYNRELVNITIVNSHNGRYTIHSSILSGADSVRLSTHVIDMTGGQSDTTMNLEKKHFLLRLDRASFPINSIKLAGHYQKIEVETNGHKDRFETVDGWDLMNLLQYGE